MFAITTAWNITSKSNVAQSLSQIKQLGFGAIEAGYNLTEGQLKELCVVCEQLEIKVTSVHNFCPLPDPPQGRRYYCDYYRLSSLDEKERIQAVSSTKKSIDTAKLLKSPIVIVHAGQVEIDHRPVKELLKLYRQGKAGTDEYIQLKAMILQQRQHQKEPYFDALARSLKEILPFAQNQSVIVALENRYYPQEIPSVAEFNMFFSEFSGETLAYWHDVGHAIVSERLGVVEEQVYLQKFSHKLVGMHLHDVKGIDDHWAPFSGDIDYSCWEEYFRDKKIVKVIESHPRATAEEVAHALKRLRALSGET